MEGTIFNIQKFCINDGDGIRTTVFLKGCPLNCIWCHNPESKSCNQQIFFNKEKCVMCGKCMAVCENNCHIFDDNKHLFNREKCKFCGKCIDACLTDALEFVGKTKSVDYVIKEVLKDKIFYENSGGGMTISGGEPMLQFDFTYELLKKAKEEGINTAIETCGFAKREKFEKILPLVDTFLFDYKITNEEEHKKYTGVSNKPILENLIFLNENKANVILRCPVIPGINDNDEHFYAIGNLAEKLECIKEVNIEPYHPLGQSKAEHLDVEYKLKDLKFVEEESVQQWINKIKTKTNKIVKKA